METTGPQTFNTTHMAMETHQEAHQHVEHSPWNMCIETHQKTMGNKEDMKARKLTHSIPRTPYLFITQKVTLLHYPLVTTIRTKIFSIILLIGELNIPSSIYKLEALYSQISIYHKKLHGSDPKSIVRPKF